MKKFPAFIICGRDEQFPVVERHLGGKLGCLDTARHEISIEVDQPLAGKHLILLHEMIHMVAEYLKDQGLISRQPDEKFVTYLAGTLFPMLVLSGLWKGVTKEELERFLREQRHE